MSILKAWLLVMSFQYNPANEALFALLCWFGIVGGIVLSIVMAYDISRGA